MAKRFFDKFTDRVGFASGKNKVLWGFLLKHHPHTLDVVASCSKIRMSPRDVLRLGTDRVPNHA